ncbi:MAG TPA: hypothetical protein VJ001_04740, partial [Rhodocyclaceae bacterium]|nr:hypothetical protein [Rhodocyclaceae bacterium]
MVFNESNERHAEFVAVREWIDARKGYLVFGGTTYKAELAKAIRYFRLVRLLYDGGKAISILDAVVD